MPCRPTVGVVITSVQGLNVTHAPIVDGAWYEIPVAAMLVGVAEKTVRNDLSEFHARFDCARYRRNIGTRWGKRLISARDVDTLRAMYPIRDTWRVVSRGK